MLTVLYFFSNASEANLGIQKRFLFFVSFVLIGTMIVLNLVIGVIMNSMDETNSEMALQYEIDRRRERPDPIRDGIDDLHKRLEELSSEMKVVKKMLEDQQAEG